MKNYSVSAIYDERCGYSVKVNGEVVFECLGKDEMKELTMAEIIKYYEEFYA